MDIKTYLNSLLILEVQRQDMRAVTQVKLPTVQRLAFLMLFSRTSRNQAKKARLLTSQCKLETLDSRLNDSLMKYPPPPKNIQHNRNQTFPLHQRCVTLTGTPPSHTHMHTCARRTGLQGLARGCQHLYASIFLIEGASYPPKNPRVCITSWPGSSQEERLEWERVLEEWKRRASGKTLFTYVD